MSRDLLFNFGTPDISETAEDTNLKFCKRIDSKGCWTKKNEKLSKSPKGGMA